MKVAVPILSLLLLLAINDALGACFFNSGVVLACIVGLALGMLLAYLMIRLNSDWNQASRILKGLMLVSLLGGAVGLMEVMNYVAYSNTVLDPASDWRAVQAAGRSLFLIEALGMFLAYRHWTPRSRLPDLDNHEQD